MSSEGSSYRRTDREQERGKGTRRPPNRSNRGSYLHSKREFTARNSSSKGDYNKPSSRNNDNRDEKLERSRTPFKNNNEKQDNPDKESQINANAEIIIDFSKDSVTEERWDDDDDVTSAISGKDVKLQSIEMIKEYWDDDTSAIIEKKPEQQSVKVKRTQTLNPNAAEFKYHSTTSTSCSYDEFSTQYTSLNESTDTADEIGDSCTSATPDTTLDEACDGKLLSNSSGKLQSGKYKSSTYKNKDRYVTRPQTRSIPEFKFHSNTSTSGSYDKIGTPYTSLNESTDTADEIGDSYTSATPDTTLDEAWDGKPGHVTRPQTRSLQEGQESFSETSTEYKAFIRKYRSLKEKEFTVVSEVEADLFTLGEEYALANCVASDFNMGSGIAVAFRQQFKGVHELLAQNQYPGGLAFLNLNGRFIYYLVTKRVSTGKPTNETMFRSLSKLKEHMIQNDVKLLAIPRLGCGLDKLEWDMVKYMIEYLFGHSDVRITVCNFQKADESMREKKELLRNRKCPVNHTNVPITNAEAYSIVIYLGTKNGHVDTILEKIDSQFRILKEYKGSERELGQLVITNVQQYRYYVIGCIVKETFSDLVDYTSFEKCVKEINKINQKFAKNGEQYGLVSMPVYHDPAEPMLMAKLENLLKNTFFKVTINIHN